MESRDSRGSDRSKSGSGSESGSGSGSGSGSRSGSDSEQDSIDDGSGMRGTKCRSKFTEDDFDKLHFIDACGHILCKNGFKTVVRKQYVGSQSPEGVECGQAINETEMRAIMGDDAIDKLQQDAIEILVRKDSSIIRGKGGNVMEVKEGKVNYNQKDEKGVKLSKDAAEHMSRYRIRCGACSENFGIKGDVTPYHIGQTGEEYKEFADSVKGRFGGSAIKMKKRGGAFKHVCKSPEGRALIKKSCDKVKECGHYCKGFRKEKEGLPCLHPDCVEEDPDETLGEDDDAFCSICFISGIGECPSIQLGCKHIFHVHGIEEKIKQKWSGPRITFLFKTCPGCKAEIKAPQHPELHDLLEEASKLEEEIKEKALERAKLEGIDKDERLKNPDDPYYEDLPKYAMHRLAYFTCYKGKSPYFGGLKDCANLLEAGEDYKEEDLVGGKCASKELGGKVTCDTHGTDYIEYKCRYCCSLSQWFCWGTTHFCDPCHRVAGNNKIKKCPGKPDCGLDVKHPDDGSEYALGCGMCRNKMMSEIK